MTESEIFDKINKVFGNKEYANKLHSITLYEQNYRMCEKIYIEQMARGEGLGAVSAGERIDMYNQVFDFAQEMADAYTNNMIEQIKKGRE